MRELATRVSFVVACVTASLGCGSRTGLEEADVPGDLDGDASDGATTSGGNGYGLCDSASGPVPADQAPGEGVTRSNASFPTCADIGGQWVCCNGPGPYNGPGGSCMFL